MILLEGIGFFSPIKIENFIGTTIPILVLIGGLLYFTVLLREAERLKNYVYTKEDIVYSLKNYNITARIKVLEILKEKDKEDVYVVNFDNRDEEFFEISLDITRNIPKSKFENLIGVDNNLFTTEMYSLIFYVPLKYERPGKKYYMRIDRFSSLEETNFSQKEIDDYKILAIELFTERNQVGKYEEKLYSMKKIVLGHIDFGKVF